MANLLGQNIGTNYKGILNLNTLNGNLTTTLEAITDGDGNASTLLLSTTLARVSSNLTIGGSTTASARLHVRGDGTNPIARFEDSSGSPIFRIGPGIGASTVQITIGSGLNLYSRFLDGDVETAALNGIYAGYQSSHQSDWARSSHYFTSSSRTFNNNSVVTGTAGNLRLVQSFAIQNANSTNINYRSFGVEYTINNTVTAAGTATGIFLNATETALNGMGHNLMDLQVGGVSQLKVGRSGIIESIGYYTGVQRILFNGGSYAINRGIINAPSNGVFTFLNAAESDFNRVQLGGTTNAFPAIKRNGAAIDFRLADDSGFCDITARQVFASLGAIYLNTAATAFILRGSGTPEGVVTAIVGSLFLRSDGGAGTTLYVKESGTGNTGWVAK